MITLNTISAIWLTSAMTISMNNNDSPVNISANVVVTALGLMLVIWCSGSISWVQWIVYLLFIGGIMIIFLILSSIMPNQKSNKIQSTWMVTLSGALMFVSLAIIGTGEEMMKIKSFMISWSNITLVIILISVYFLTFLACISSNSTTLRNSSCYNGETL